MLAKTDPRLTQCTLCGKWARSKKDGACPNCGAEVRKWNGVWVPVGEDSPGIQLGKLLEKRINEVLGTTTFTFPRNRRGYLTETVARLSNLIQKAGTLDRAKVAVEVLYTHQTFNPINLTGLGLINYHWRTALALADKIIMEREAKKKVAGEAFRQMDSRSYLLED